MSLLRTIRLLELANIRVRVGRTSQPFTTAAFAVLIRAGAATRWASRTAHFTSLAPLIRRADRGSSVHRTRPWPQRRPLRGGSAVCLSPRFVPEPRGRACRRPRTMFNDVWAGIVDEPMSLLHGVRNTALEVARSRITPGHMGTRRCQSKVALVKRPGSIGENGFGRSDRSAQCRWLWPGRLRRPPRWESRKEVEWSAPLGSDRPGAAVMARRLPRPDDSRRAEFLLPRLQTVRNRVRIRRSARER